ncbi:d99e07fe-2df0-492e-9305-e01d445d4ce0 [Thermothielavioides terrestris]|uniref:Uncharacterized protein n=2 Tax=Thermothielavioides terrestris TaxID=2587410 RepID=G2R0D2_THETT|nr:uncharacterized protein THITE_2112733 [Thermothielavioides terrestris NRRL 8126]AEO65597.1 hypothetical protein THITE_2112733 [Thermothielavioides terrestris NRRL 8126]SPQ19146.1 d99e07fe-2df0-492e-9305-e01d445d4ce0 [Thermothielavioides terrestris]
MADITGQRAAVLGPLTTTWTMPDSCTVHVLDCATCSEGFRGQTCIVSDGSVEPVDYTGCWPPITDHAPLPRTPFLGWGFYSPGLVCPAGYTTACSAEYGKRAEWDIQFTLLPGETAVGCCPEGFRCTNANGNTCIAFASIGTQIEVTTGMCASSGLFSVNQATFPDVITTTTTDSASNTTVEAVTRQMILLAPMFQMNYQSSDLVSSSSSSSSSAASTSTPTSGVSSSTPTQPGATAGAGSAAEGLSASGKGGLSTGAVVGIAVGAALAGVLLTAIVAWIWFKRRGERAAAAGQGPAGWAGDGAPWAKPPPVYEVAGNLHTWPTSEMYAAQGSMTAELPTEAGRG